jgi:heme-degrading monooxygenase HmoA
MLKNYSKISVIMKETLDIKYAKHNRVRLKEGKRDKITKMFIEFFNKVEGKTKGMEGYIIMDNIKDSNESIVITFWNSKQDMDTYYQPHNKDLSDLIEKAKPSFEQMPERSSYSISRLKM